MKLSRLDIHIIVNILIGMLIGGVLVWGLSQRELDGMRAQMHQQAVKIQLLELGLNAIRRDR